MELGFLTELSLILLISLVISLILKLLKQPLIVGYIITGMIAGGYLVNSLEIKNIIKIFSELGVALMLFIVGLDLKFKIFKEIGKQSIMIAVLQEIFTILIGFFILLLLNFNYLESLYLSIAISFSSTIIMIKLISDKGDLEKLYGKLAIGFLIIQDFITVILLIIFPLLPINNNINNISINFEKLFSSIILILGLPLLGIYFLPKIENIINSSKEILFLFSITFLLIVSSLFKLLGLGLEVGALIAGVTMANLVSSSEISLKLKSLKEFFLIIFFIYLGFNLTIPQIKDLLLIPGIAISLFVIIGNPLILYILLKLMKINNKSSFMLGLTSAQISEFSFIFISLGNKLNHIESNLLSLIALVGLVTIFVSSYMVYYSEKLYNLIFRKILRIKEKYEINEKILKEEFEILLIGCDRTGYSFLVDFEEKKEKILIIDYNYEKVKKLAENGYKVIYGDVSEIELLEEINLSRFPLIISTIPDFEINLIILKNYKKLNKKGIFICNSINFKESLTLYNKGADYVNMHHLLGGKNLSKLVKNSGYISENYETIKKEDFEKIKNILSYLSTNNT